MSYNFFFLNFNYYPLSKNTLLSTTQRQNSSLFFKKPKGPSQIHHDPKSKTHKDVATLLTSQVKYTLDSRLHLRERERERERERDLRQIYIYVNSNYKIFINKIC